jgi:hypothetical protein
VTSTPTGNGARTGNILHEQARRALHSLTHEHGHSYFSLSQIRERMEGYRDTVESMALLGDAILDLDELGEVETTQREELLAKLVRITIEKVED